MDDLNERAEQAVDDQETAQLAAQSEWLGRVASSPPLLRLSEEFPEEVAFFQKTFLWSGNKAGFYTRAAYHTTDGRRPWHPFKKFGGEWQHLYTNLVLDLAEKHLDFDRFCRTSPPKSQVRPRDHETAFWLGTMAGERTCADCLDIDSHDVVGWYSVPTRWHPSRNPFAGSAPLYDYRFLPVVRLSLAHFHRLKAFQDVFINRLWAFSSANLGLALWRIYPKAPKNTRMRFDELQRQLDTAGLAGTEAYPCPPKSNNSLGRCHRRPCGMDSGIITETGVVTDAIEQVCLFMKPPPTPSFPAICTAIFAKLDEMYTHWLSCPEGFSLDRTTPDQRHEIVAGLVADLDQVKDWLHSGCPMPRTVTGHETTYCDDPAGTPLSEAGERPDDVAINRDDSVFCDTNASSVYPDSFHRVDLAVINDSGQWVQFCVFLAQHGFPCHDRFLEVVSTLAKWFAYVELYHLLPDRIVIKELLRDYCLNKHNGFISRLNNGLEDEVLAHVDRVVDDAIDTVSPEGKAVFSELRQKRDNNYYPEDYLLEGLVSLSSLHTPSSNSPIPCGLLRGKKSDGGNWVYHPDNTPLPESLLEAVKQGIVKTGIRLRKNRTGGFPTLQAVTRLINYLYAGRGRRRASRILLEQMGFPTSSSKKEKVKKALVRAGVLHKGGYVARRKSRLYMLSSWALEQLNRERTDGRTTA